MSSPSDFEGLILEVLRLKREQGSELESVAREVGMLYQSASVGEEVRTALLDPFFPISLYVRHHLNRTTRNMTRVPRAAQDLALLSQMHLRIREDINRHFDNRRVTTVDLNTGAVQEVPSSQWCSFCGECCQLGGTVPDPPDGIRYPGYWYTYLAGDGPVVQRFCPFLFELAPQGLFFCSIHNVKPDTCLAYGREDCQANHPGKALGC